MLKEKLVIVPILIFPYWLNIFHVSLVILFHSYCWSSWSILVFLLHPSLDLGFYYYFIVEGRGA